MQMKILVLLCVFMCASCALVPNSISPEFEHISHLTQHFGAIRTNYGANIANITAEWDVGKRFYMTLAEGVDLDRRYTVYGQQEHGEIIGPREEFTGRIGYKFTVRP
jgi:hypothetical protein